MAVILDVASSISSPPSMTLFDDTGKRTVYFAPRVWKLRKENGVDLISYTEMDDDDFAVLQVTLEPWVDSGELSAVKHQAQALGMVVQPVRYLGTSAAGVTGGQISVPYSFPDDPRFRCVVNNGAPGAFDNPVNLVFNCSKKVGQFLKKITETADGGLRFTYAASIKGASTQMEAHLVVHYDRAYELLATHTSWSWWLWSGDFQAAWQSLHENGGITGDILGGTDAQKAAIYKMCETVRDLFFKPELGNVTSPTHPDSGIIRTSLRYEKQNEHKEFHYDWVEREFTTVPFQSPCFTGKHNLSQRSLLTPQNKEILRPLLQAAASGGTRVRHEPVPDFLFSAYEKHFAQQLATASEG